MHATKKHYAILAEYESTVSQKLFIYKINDLEYIIKSSNCVTFPVMDIDEYIIYLQYT